MRIGALFKAEYVYRPTQLVRRIVGRRANPGMAIVTLPWGQQIRVSTRDDIGSQICGLGLFDLVVSEVILRLADAGETAVDAGANVGYMTCVLAHAVGSGGSVWAFEPHPGLFEELSQNAVRILSFLPGVSIVLRQLALTDSTQATVTLHVPADFERNRGTSSVAMPQSNSTPVQVPCAKLDDALPRNARIGVLKIDVEGYECQVLRGASSLVGSGRVRDVIFEQHDPYPSELTRLFESMSYRVFRLQRSLHRPLLLRPDSHLPRTAWEATSYLATRDPDRALARLAPPGWQALRIGRRQ